MLKTYWVLTSFAVQRNNTLNSNSVSFSLCNVSSVSSSIVSLRLHLRHIINLSILSPKVNSRGDRNTEKHTWHSRTSCTKHPIAPMTSLILNRTWSRARMTPVVTCFHKLNCFPLELQAEKEAAALYRVSSISLLKFAAPLSILATLAQM